VFSEDAIRQSNRQSKWVCFIKLQFGEGEAAHREAERKRESYVFWFLNI
jgi:hypothetical protein